MFQSRGKNIILWVVILTFTLSMAACGSSERNSVSSESTTAAAAISGEADKLMNETGLPIVNEPMTFKAMVKKSDWDKIKWSEKEAVKTAAMETGISFQWDEIAGIAWDEKIGVVIASGDLPDVIIGQIMSFSDMTGSFQELDGLTEKYAPYLTEFYKTHPNIKYAVTQADGKMYSMPLVQLHGNSANSAFAINNSWLEKLGLKVPTTHDELYNVLKAFKTSDPNGNGQADEIPFGFYLDNTYSVQQLMWSFGLINDGNDAEHNVMVENGKVFFIATDNRYYDFLKYLNKLYQEGLLDPDGFVQKDADFTAKGNKGLYGMFAHHSYDDIVVGADKTGEYKTVLPMKDSNGKITISALKVPGDFESNKFTITKNCKNPEVLVRFYDYTNSTWEKRMLWAWGPENVSWKNVADGKIQKITDNFPDGISNYAELRQTFSPGMAGFYLWSEEDQSKFNLTSERDQKYFAREALYEPYFYNERIPIGNDTEEATNERNSMATEINTYVINFFAESVLKGIDDAKWQENLKTCEKLNVDKFVADYQNYYDKAIAAMKN